MLQEIQTTRTRPQVPESLEELFSAETLSPPTHRLQEVIDRIEWTYPYKSLLQVRARRSVTDLKHQIDIMQDTDFNPDLPVGLQAAISDSDTASAQKQESSGLPIAAPFRRRPRFLAEQPLTPTAAEKGSWTHLFLQQFDLEGSLDFAGLELQMKGMIKKGIFSDHQACHVDLSGVARLFAGPLGQRILSCRRRLYREWPFTLAVPAGDIETRLELDEQERKELVLVRGVIDCLFQTDSGWVIVDYKTDEISPSQCPERALSYTSQLHLYRRAVETILAQPVAEAILYFLTPAIAVPVLPSRAHFG